MPKKLTLGNTGRNGGDSGNTSQTMGITGPDGFSITFGFGSIVGKSISAIFKLVEKRKVLIFEKNKFLIKDIKNLGAVVPAPKKNVRN